VLAEGDYLLDRFSDDSGKHGGQMTRTANCPNASRSKSRPSLK
jgi:hypothetical protein